MHVSCKTPQCIYSLSFFLCLFVCKLFLFSTYFLFLFRLSALYVPVRQKMLYSDDKSIAHKRGGNGGKVLLHTIMHIMHIIRNWRRRRLAALWLRGV